MILLLAGACDVPPDWHARYLATGKHYRYLLVLRPHSAFNYRYATFLPREYDWELCGPAPSFSSDGMILLPFVPPVPWCAVPGGKFFPLL